MGLRCLCLSWAHMRMATSGESCDLALPLLALGLHPLLRFGPGGGCPRAEARARATCPLCIHSGPSSGQPAPAEQGACGRGSPCAPAASPAPCLPALPCPACAAARRAGSRGCVGGELLHCGSWAAANGLVLLSPAAILTWPWARRRGWGPGAEGMSSTQGPKAAERLGAGSSSSHPSAPGTRDVLQGHLIRLNSLELSQLLDHLMRVFTGGN